MHNVYSYKVSTDSEIAVKCFYKHNNIAKESFIKNVFPLKTTTLFSFLNKKSQSF